MHLDAEVAERVGARGRPGVNRDHAVAERDQELRCRLAGLSETNDEIRARRHGRARSQLKCCVS
jgi:hypothetical protein